MPQNDWKMPFTRVLTTWQENSCRRKLQNTIPVYLPWTCSESGGGEEVERLVSDVGGEMCTVFSTAVCVFFFFSPSLAANHGSAGGCPYTGFNSSSGCKRNSKGRILREITTVVRVIVWRASQKYV